MAEERVIHRVVNAGEVSYVIAENQVWLPGSYADEETARRAFDLPDAVLYGLQERVNNVAAGEGRLITASDLDRAGNSP